jgi:hypothetical protein
MTYYIVPSEIVDTPAMDARMAAGQIPSRRTLSAAERLARRVAEQSRYGVEIVTRSTRGDA